MLHSFLTEIDAKPHSQLWSSLLHTAERETLESQPTLTLALASPFFPNGAPQKTQGKEAPLLELQVTWRGLGGPAGTIKSVSRANATFSLVCKTQSLRF
jgi:hypothetical protein